MQFTFPTSKAEMFSALQDIYNFYRIKREGFEQTLLKEISLEEMSFTKLTDEQLSNKAQTLVKANHEREILALEKSVKDEIAALNAKKATIEKNAVSLVDKIKSAYEESESKVEKEAALRGFYNSSATVDKIAELEAKKNAEIATAEASKNADVAEIDAKISALNSSLTTANKYYSDVHDYEKSAKAAELKDEQKKSNARSLSITIPFRKRCKSPRTTSPKTICKFNLSLWKFKPIILPKNNSSIWGIIPTL